MARSLYTPRLVDETEMPKRHGQIGGTCDKVILTELVRRCTVPYLIVMCKKLPKLFACACRLAAKQLQCCQQPAGENGEIGRGVTPGELNRLLGVHGSAVESPDDELEYLSAVKGRENLLGIAELLAQLQALVRISALVRAQYNPSPQLAV